MSSRNEYDELLEDIDEMSIEERVAAMEEQRDTIEELTEALRAANDRRAERFDELVALVEESNGEDELPEVTEQ